MKYRGILKIRNIGNYRHSFLVSVNPIGRNKRKWVYHPTTDTEIKSVRTKNKLTKVANPPEIECLYVDLNNEPNIKNNANISDFTLYKQNQVCVFVQKDKSRNRYKINGFYKGKRIEGARKFAVVNSSGPTRFRVKGCDTIVEVNKINNNWTIKLEDYNQKSFHRTSTPNFEEQTQVLKFNYENKNQTPFLKKI